MHIFHTDWTISVWSVLNTLQQITFSSTHHKNWNLPCGCLAFQSRDTCCKRHNGRSYRRHRHGIFHTLRSETGPYLRRQTDYTPDNNTATDWLQFFFYLVLTYLSEFNLAAVAVVAYVLSLSTDHANHFFNRFSIQSVRFLFVVT